MLNISKKRVLFYEILCTILIICINLMFQFDEKQFSSFFKLIGIISFGIVCFCFVAFSLKYDFQTRELLIILLLLLLQFVCFAFKDNDSLLLLVFAVLFFFLDEISIVRIYLWSLIVVFIITSISSLSGLLPVRADGYLVLGFGYKNRIGFIIFSIAVYLFSIIKLRDNSKLGTLVGNCILIFTAIFEQLVQDKTALMLIILFMMMYNFHIFRINNVILKLSSVCLPVILTILSLFLAFNFSKYQWILKLNDLLSWRIGLWNNDWGMYHISWFPQNINSFFSYVTSYGQYLTITATDGYFALGILQNGIIFFVVSIIALMYMVFYNFKNVDNKKEIILCLSIIFMLFSFSENIPLLGYLCFLFPTAFGFRKQPRININ